MNFKTQKIRLLLKTNRDRIIVVLTMNMMLLVSSFIGYAADVTSPNGKIAVSLHMENVNKRFGEAFLQIQYTNGKTTETMLSGIRLGLATDKRKFIDALRLIRQSKAKHIREDYQMLKGKRSHCSNEASERIFTFENAEGQQFNVTVRAYNDGLAFRYGLGAVASEHVTDEYTTFHIAEGTKTWIQRYKNDYEGFYHKHRSDEQGLWGYPALIENSPSAYVLITESNITRGNCGSQLDNRGDHSQYKVAMGDKSVAINGTWASPWRTLMVGSLADVVGSTLVTDVSDPQQFKDTDWIQPGNVSWIYWAYNNSSSDFEKVREYIDLASKMNWEYSLIDWKWDAMKNGGDVKDAIRYALQKGIKPLLWYNSGTGWIGQGAPGPLDRLNTKENREKEFQWLSNLGVAGIKIDFFKGDDVEMMNYYQDLLEDAAKYKLMVNLHGSTLPRGWERTYPNLMTMEAVYGAEWYNNNDTLTTRAAVHNVTLPFTRNVVGPMDYTPGTFSDSQFKHITSHGHELALMVAFESAWQHRPDRPSAYEQLPAAVRELLSSLPVTWDDTRLLSGYPGEQLVMARRKGTTWYVAGLNGSDEAKELVFNPKQLSDGALSISIFADGDTAHSFSQKMLGAKETLNDVRVKCLERGGFVAVIKAPAE